jgi:hypothetical protein
MSASTVSVAPTMAVLIQEEMAKMPDTFNTKKEIEEYFKNAMKEIVMKKKEEEKANKPEKPKKAAKKPKKEDTDSNDEEKPEKPKKAAKKPKKEDTYSNDEEKPKKADKKPKKEKELDEDGNEIKKPPTEYIIFKKEMAIKIKDQFPDLNYQKAQKKINDLWKIHKNGHTEEF